MTFRAVWCAADYAAKGEHMSTGSYYTGMSSLTLGINNPISDYILSPCPSAARGLETLLNADKRSCCIIMSGDRDQVAGRFRKVTSESRVVVYLPNELISFLTTLKELSLLFRIYRHPLPVLILSMARPEWLYSTLYALTDGVASLTSIRIVSPENSLRTLASMIKTWNQVPLLAKHRKISTMREGMTSSELDTIINLFCDVDIMTQATNLGLSHQTLYSRRMSGLSKLSGEFPQLINLLPRRRRAALLRHGLNREQES
jgi:hypothetical protein